MNAELLKTSIICSTEQESSQILLADGDTGQFLFGIQGSHSADNCSAHLHYLFQFDSDQGRDKTECLRTLICFDCLHLCHKLTMVVLVVHVVTLENMYNRLWASTVAIIP